MSRLNNSIIDALVKAAGPGGAVSDPEALEPHLTEWRGLYRGCAPVMLQPASTDAVAAILRLCNEHGIGVVPQGGNTGLAGGAIPGLDGREEILLSLHRLKRLRALDADNFTLTVEAGCILSEIQQRAEEAGLLFPLSLAAEGSCQIGGNLSTNAGGTNVLRYGNTRDLVLGLEVVLPDGSVLNDLSGLRKDNTGYDLKQLFIGAEGTLGVITAATLKLFPAPRSRATALLAVTDAARAVELYGRARDRIGDDMVAFELMPRIALDMVFEHIPGLRDPVGAPYPWYVLLELANARPQALTEESLADFVQQCFAAGLVADGVAASSSAQARELWAIRHAISEAQKLAGGSIKHDISVPVSRMPEFITAASDAVADFLPGSRPVAFGHLGDGNVHFNVSPPEAMEKEQFVALWPQFNELIHSLAVEMGGSFSAEHGIGALKAGELARLKDPVAMELMRAVKRAIDPRGIMNAGKVLK